MTESKPAVAWEAPPEAGGPAPGIEFAPHGGRFISYIIDSLISSLIIGIPILIGTGIAFSGSSVTSAGQVTNVSPVAAGAGAFLFVLGLVVGIAYFPWFWVHGGQTPGMKPFGLYVVRDRDGGPIGWGSAILRLIGLWIGGAIFYLGYIWILIDSRRRGWHDLIAGSVVIRRRPVTV